MTSETTTVAGDGHFHIYPCHDPAEIIGRLVDNLALLAGRDSNAFKIAFFAESRACDYFNKIRDRKISFEKIGLEISHGPEEHCISLRRGGRTELCLVAGRQIVTAEKLEVLGLAMEVLVPDGQPEDETVRMVAAAGGLPVLAFAPGKWFFGRGIVARGLVGRFGKELIIGDSALRPRGWTRPDIMCLSGAAVLPGSDPLPMPGEEKYAGSYGFVYRGDFDTARPLAAMKRIMAGFPSAIMPAGLRCSVINVAARLFRLKGKAEGREKKAECKRGDIEA